MTQDHLTKQWSNSDATVTEQWYLWFPFAMQLKCDYASAGYTRLTAKNSDQTVIKHWWNSDASTVMRQWYNSHAFDLSSFLCLLFRLFIVIFKLLRCHWSYFILLQCLGSVFGHTRPFDKNSDGTVMQQWSNSDAFDLSFSLLFSRLWDVIDHIPSFCNAFEVIFKVLRFHWSILSFCNACEVWLWVCWWHKTILQIQWSNSDETVMQQRWNSDAFGLSSFMSFARFWDVIDRILSFCNALKVCLETQMTKTMIKQWLDSDATVIEQGWFWFELFDNFFKVLRCHWSFFILLQCLGIVFGDTRPFDKNSDLTVMRQWWNSDQTVIPLIWAPLCHLQAFKMTWMKFYPLTMHLKCDYASAGETTPFYKNSDQTVMRQWWNSHVTVMEQWYYY
jgi:hypothetical protein